MLNFFKKSRHILGINARNLTYLRPSNSIKAIRIADDKLLAKKILSRNGLPVAKTYSIIRTIDDLENLDWSSLPNSFVLKPNKGLGGEGILVVYGRHKKESRSWVKADRRVMTVDDLKGHALHILEGAFSRTGLSDVVFFEERIRLIKQFKPYAHRGIPDIRIIVYNKVPVMAELRLPTKESDGRSNLHLGGIGAGIDLGTGVTTTAVQNNRLIEYIPGTRLSLKGIHIPEWKEILRLAVHAQQITKIGFLGIDIAIDREKGPAIFELNARPGLAIQIANLSSLKDRLQRVGGLRIGNINKGVELAQNLFGGEIEEELEEISGRKVIGINEPIEIIGANEEKYATMAKVDTGAYRTTICQTLAGKLGIDKAMNFKKVRGALGAEERPIINFSFILDKRLVETEAFLADRTEMKYDIIVGRRDLKRFLIDPAKNVFMRKKI